MASKLDELIKNPDRFVAFEDEMMLSWWKDEPNGMTVTLVIPPDTNDGPHPFKRYLVGTKTSPGTRFFVRMIELGETDEPVDQELRKRVLRVMDDREGSSKRASQEAATLCQSPLFHAFVRDQLFDLMTGQEREEIVNQLPHGVVGLLRAKHRAAFDDPRVAGEVCKHYIYVLARIKSRSDLDNHPKILMRYKAVIIEPFVEWREKQRMAARQEHQPEGSHNAT